MLLTIQTLFNDPDVVQATIDRVLQQGLDRIYWQQYLTFRRTTTRVFKDYLGTVTGVVAGSINSRYGEKPIRERKSLGSGYGEIAYLGDAYQMDVERLSELQDLINEKCPTYYTARDVKTILKAMYKRAMVDSIIQKNIAEFIVLPKMEEHEATPFTTDELKALWDLFDRKDYFVGYILLMCYTGMMPAELLACKKSNVDTEKQEIVGCGAKTKTRKKSAIVYPDLLAPVVASIMATDGDKLIHINKDLFYEEYYACLERAGVEKKVPYSCRHTYATEAVKLGVHPAVVQKMLRHSTQKVQERYTHLSSEEAHEAAKLFSRG